MSYLIPFKWHIIYLILLVPHRIAYPQEFAESIVFQPVDMFIASASCLFLYLQLAILALAGLFIRICRVRCDGV